MRGGNRMKRDTNRDLLVTQPTVRKTNFRDIFSVQIRRRYSTDNTLFMCAEKPEYSRLFYLHLAFGLIYAPFQLNFKRAETTTNKFVRLVHWLPAIFLQTRTKTQFVVSDQYQVYFVVSISTSLFRRSPYSYDDSLLSSRINQFH